MKNQDKYYFFVASFIPSIGGILKEVNNVSNINMLNLNDNLIGYWDFNEGSGSTAYDNADNMVSVEKTVWKFFQNKSGKYGNGVILCGKEKGLGKYEITLPTLYNLCNSLYKYLLTFVVINVTFIVRYIFIRIIYTFFQIYILQKDEENNRGG